MKKDLSPGFGVTGRCYMTRHDDAVRLRHMLELAREAVVLSASNPPAADLRRRWSETFD